MFICCRTMFLLLLDIPWPKLLSNHIFLLSNCFFMMISFKFNLINSQQCFKQKLKENCASVKKCTNIQKNMIHVQLKVWDQNLACDWICKEKLQDQKFICDQICRKKVHCEILEGTCWRKCIIKRDNTLIFFLGRLMKEMKLI
jgi:hypothetical protein